MRLSFKFVSLCLCLVFALGVSGCLSPLATHRAVLEYDRTVSYVEADLLLLNIARARYHRPVHFTAVSSVAATFDFRTDAGIRGGIGHAVDPSEYPLGLEYGVSVAENPTITIIPITGEEFTKRILHPLSENTLRALMYQGYELNMLLRLMARGLSVEDRDGQHLLINRPSEEGFHRISPSGAASSWPREEQTTLYRTCAIQRHPNYVRSPPDPVRSSRRQRKDIAGRRTLSPESIPYGARQSDDS